MKAITDLDNLISGKIEISSAENYEHDTATSMILTSLFNHALDQDSQKNEVFKKYIYYTFECLIQHKDVIRLRIQAMDDNIKDRKFLGLIMYHLDRDTEAKDTQNNFINLFKPELLKIFNKTVKLEISTWDTSYEFSIQSLMGLIKGTSVTTIIIKSDASERRKSWLDKWYHSISAIEIKQRYSIEFKHINEHYGNDTDYLTIKL